MKAKLVTYTTERLNKSEKSKLSKKLFGYTDKSYHGKYTYKRKGLLEGTKYVKVYKNTFIIALEDWRPLREELKKRKATVRVWDITIEKF